MKNPRQNSNPQIENYREYRKFLRDFLNQKREENPRNSLIYYSRKMGLSGAYLKLVLNGKRNLGVDHAAALGKCFRWNYKQRVYLYCMILREESKSADVRAFFSNLQNDLKKDPLNYESDPNQVSIFSNVLLWEIFSLLGIEGFIPDPSWIKSKLEQKKLQLYQIQSAWNQLLAIGAVVNSAGRWKASDKIYKHGNDVKKVYTLALRRALDHLEFFQENDRSYFDSFCLILSDSEYEQIRTVLEEAKSKVAAIARRSGMKTRIAYFNSNLFYASRA